MIHTIILFAYTRGYVTFALNESCVDLFAFYPHMHHALMYK